MCGEQSRFRGFDSGGGGSSPRVRGTDDAPVEGQETGRFIPACAGNSTVVRIGSITRAVHPRVCGEQRAQHSRRLLFRGSSPRVRGTGQLCVHWRLSSRFIPRVRGTVIELPDESAVRRFIPACAGNRNRRVVAQGKVAVHPRVCGEQDRGRIRWRTRRGSSPRVRGTGRLTRAKASPIRFIPACAGNSSSPTTAFLPMAVHPRVCGEQLIMPCVISQSAGSSPRVRGTGVVTDNNR